jgi:hypothetical protein
MGVDNVVFRQLMLTDATTHLDGAIVRQSNAMRVQLEPILDAVSADPSFTFQRQVLGYYYYYVEVWRHAGVDVVFEEADLAQLERVKQEAPEVIHELVFHPNALLASTWQPWDGVLGPDGRGTIPRRDARPHDAVTSSGSCIRGRESRQTQSLVE